MLNKIIDKPLHLKYATCLVHLLLTETYKFPILRSLTNFITLIVSDRKCTPALLSKKYEII